MILLPGARSTRVERRSRLSFCWHARDASLVPITGQTATLVQTGATTLTSGPVVPMAGSQITAGKAMPRFGRDVLTGENFLQLAGNVSGQDVEQLTYAMALRAKDLTLLLRVTGLWAAGANVSQGGMLALGTAPGTEAGSIRLQRGGLNYTLTRHMGGLNNSGVLAEPAALVWPADLLIQYGGTTGIASLSIRSATGAITGPVTAGSASFISAGRWGGNALAVGSDPAGGLPGVPARYYVVKLAMGIKTFADMDALT